MTSTRLNPTISGQGIADYVVSRYDSGNWKCVKWNSGFAECFGTHAFTGISLTSQSGGTYYGSNKSLNLPSNLFKTIHSAFAMASSVPYRTGHSSGIIVHGVENGTTTKIEVDFRSHTSISNGSTGAYFHVSGTWK